MFPDSKKFEPKIPDAPRLSDLESTLEKRKTTYGSFFKISATSQRLKKALIHTSNFQHLGVSKKESIEMILHKIARIVHGDPEYLDNWHDIAGYATLIEKEINEICKNQ